MLPWLLYDYNQSERDMALSKYRIMVFLVSLLGLVVPVFNAWPRPNPRAVTNRKISKFNFTKSTIKSLFMNSQEIPIVNLKTEFDGIEGIYSKSILENEIKGIQIEYVTIAGTDALKDLAEEGHKTIYLFFGGTGNLLAANKHYELTPETIFLPGVVEDVSIVAAGHEALQYLKISCEQTPQDLLDLKEFPPENTDEVYYAKFADCQSYSETIKSPNTVSRTILPNKYIPRVAMGTVQTKGPDEVGAHKHPMLEQLFLGLSKNNCTVYADAAETGFPENALLHIPLGSTHSVSVEKDEVMYYVWMDFFLKKEGEEWLKTHKVNED